MQEVYPVIAIKSKHAGGIICWTDETTLEQVGHRERGYVLPCYAPVLEATSKRFDLTMVSAVSSKGMLRFKFHEGAARPRRPCASCSGWCRTAKDTKSS